MKALVLLINILFAILANTILPLIFIKNKLPLQT